MDEGSWRTGDAAAAMFGGVWRRLQEVFLQEEHLVGFVDGEMDGDDIQVVIWMRDESWTTQRLNSLSSDLIWQQS